MCGGLSRQPACIAVRKRRVTQIRARSCSMRRGCSGLLDHRPFGTASAHRKMKITFEAVTRASLARYNVCAIFWRAVAEECSTYLEERNHDDARATIGYLGFVRGSGWSLW